MLEVRLLGQFEVRLDSRPIIIPSRPAQSLLAYLMLSAGTAHRREKLAGLLWPEVSEANARSNLRQALWRIRQAIEPDPSTGRTYLQADNISVAFDTNADYWLDAAVLEQEVDEGCSADDLMALLSVYHGELLPGFYEEWVILARERLQAVFEYKMQRLLDRLIEAQRWPEVLAWGERWIAWGHTPEPAYRALMIAHHSLGDTASMAAVFQRCVEALRKELGVEPSSQTRALYEQLRVGEPGKYSPPTPMAQAIRGYELRERIGAGGFGEVYRAYQPSVGREVAIKVILPQYANQPDFIRRFEAEAQLVARLEHLHIVPLYDYWREPDGAYLVMRWLRGGNLRDSLRRGPWPPDASARLLDQIAGALTAAHRQGVIHRDIKPENIMLDEEGNAYLSDFGIAKDLSHISGQTEEGVVSGSPAYVSPEQAESQRLTAQSDLYSLGVIMYEVLIGEHPFAGLSPAAQLLKHLTEPMPPVRERRPDLPEAVEQVLRRATAKDPAARYPDALAFAAVFRVALSPGPAMPVKPQSPDLTLEIVNPYKGLRAFAEADAADFFGREALVEQLLARLREAGEQGSEKNFSPAPLHPRSPTSSHPRTPARFLAVVGPSGSGKSSVVKAGLLPALRRGVLPGSDKWFIVEMLPGTHPWEELEIGLLRIAANQPTGLMEQLRRDARGLLRTARLVLPTNDSELLLIVDQFEELFTLTEDKAEPERFLDSLFAAASDPCSRVRVIITLRADFYDRPLLHPDFSQLMRQQTEVVVPLTAEELAQAIAAPAERVGVTFEPDLVTRIVAEVNQQPGALPLLQYALTELFERRADHLLTKKAYQSIGGVSGALARRAEEVYAGLDEAGQAAVRQLFLRLVALGEGVEDTRRRVLRAEVEALTSGATGDGRPETGLENPVPSPRSPVVDSKAIAEVIEAFGRWRLLSFDRDPLTREPTVEVAHEALLREWGRLREWLDASRADVRLQRLLAVAAAEWIAANRDLSFLLHGGRLAQFEGWAAGSVVALTQDERAFLEASIAERQVRQAEEEARQRRELEAAQQLAEAERQRAETQARAAQALRRRAVFLAGALLIAGILAVVAVLFGQQASRNARQAQHDAQIALAREWAAAAISNLDVDPERSVLLALQAVSVTYNEDGTVIREAENALHRAVPSLRTLLSLPGHASSVYDMALSPDGTRMATASIDGTAKIWNITPGPTQGEERELLALTGHTDWLWGVAFSPDGTRLATASRDGTAKVWDAATGRELFTLSGHSGEVYDVVFSPDGTRLATASADGTVKMWGVTAPTRSKLLFTLAYTGYASVVAFSPDGAFLAIAGEGGAAAVWNLTAITLASPDSPISAQEAVLTLCCHSTDIIDITFSPECGSPPEAAVEDSPQEGEQCSLRLATASNDKTAKLWDAATGRELLTLYGHTGPVNVVTFNADGTRLVTQSGDGLVKIWAVPPGATGGQELLTIPGISGYGDLTSDGASLITVKEGGSVTVSDIAPSRELLTLSGHTDWVWGVAFSPDGTRIATAGFDQTAKVWDISTALREASLGDNAGATTGQVLFTLPEGAHTDWVNTVAFSPDGTRLATASNDATAKVWDLTTGRELFTLTGHTYTEDGFPYQGVGHVVFSPDGTRLATSGGDGTARLWDAMTGQELLTLSAHSQVVTGVAFDASGARLATVSFDGTAKVWDVSDGPSRGQVLFTLTLEGQERGLWSFAFSPDGTRLAITQRDGTVISIWDASPEGSREQPLQTLIGHTSIDTGAAFSPDGTRLATASFDGTAKVWDVATGEELLTLTGHNGGVTSVAFSPDGKRLVTGSQDGTARVYVLPIEELMALARSRLTRSFTLEECQRFLHMEQCP